jgi:hypothetical protein
VPKHMVGCCCSSYVGKRVHCKLCISCSSVCITRWTKRSCATWGGSCAWPSDCC